MLDFKVDGLKALDDLLKQLPEQVAKRELVGAMRAGGNTIRKEAIARAPDSPKKQKYGDLRENIRVVGSGGRSAFGWADSNPNAAVTVRLTTGRAFWAKWVEFGRGPVKAKPGDVLADGTKVLGKEVAAAAPRPFMRPAYDAAAPRAIATVAARLKAGVDRQVKRLRLAVKK